MGRTNVVAHDPSVAVRRRHLPGFAREEFDGEAERVGLP